MSGGKGKATAESEAHVSDVRPDNTLERLVKLGATCESRKRGPKPTDGARNGMAKPKTPQG